MRSPMRATPALVILGVLAGVAISAQGCSYVANETAVQCTSQKECVDLGAGFENTTCDPVTKTCVPVAAPPECQANRDCLPKGNTFVCRKSDKKCVNVLSPECPTLMGTPDLLQNDDALVLGAITPVASGELGDAIERGARLAQLELTPTTTATNVPAGGKNRPVVIVSCKEFNSDGYTGLLAAANHLVKNVETPVIVGPTDPSDAELVVKQVTLPNQVLAILPATITTNIDTLNPPGRTPLIWRLNYGDVQAANVIQNFITRVLIPKIQKDTGDQDIRIGLVSEGDYKGEQVGQVMLRTLRWNTGADGTTPLDCIENGKKKPNQACFLANFGNLNDTIGNPAPDGKIAVAVNQMMQAQAFAPPHIIVHSYATFGIEKILFGVEGGWDQAHGPTSPNDTDYKRRAYHIGVFAPWNTFVPMFEFMDRQTSKAGPEFYWPLRERVFALYARDVGDQEVLQGRVREYKNRMLTKFPEADQTDTLEDVLPRLFYDGVYLAAYAIVANGTKALTGSNLADTLPRLVQGSTQVVTGPDFPRGFGLLSAPDSRIKIAGVSGNLNLNVATGSPKYNMEISCPGKDEQTGKTTNFVPSGYYFDEEAQVPVGKFDGSRCPWLKDKPWP